MWGRSSKGRKAAVRRRRGRWYSGVDRVTWDADVGGWAGDLEAFWFTKPADWSDEVAHAVAENVCRNNPLLAKILECYRDEQEHPRRDLVAPGNLLVRAVTGDA